MKFSIPTRYDMKDAVEGKDFEVVDEAGNSYGVFKCAYLDTTSPRTELAYKRVRAKHAHRINSKELKNLEAVKVVFVECVLKDWSGVLDEKGKEIPFSIENAMAYFSVEEKDFEGQTYYPTRHVLEKLGEFAGNAANFQPAEATVEAIEKN